VILLVQSPIPEDIHKFLRTRRSIRRFKSMQVPLDVIHRIIETATYAPSAHNTQPWRFVVVENAAAKSRLAKALTHRFLRDMEGIDISHEEIQSRIDRTIRRTNEAPVIIILCRDKNQVKPNSDPNQRIKEETMAIQSVALAGLQLLLAAHAEGLGGNWICWPLYSPDETLHALELNECWEPEGMMIVGYPDEKPDPPEKLSYQEVTKFI
jgi:coenzyme F420-0:L-glutamate ligase/coenzyme F420-1:gamma-L-glutamate ligase